MAMPDGFFAAEKEEIGTGGSTLGNDAVDRQERLGRVRTDLLAEQELGFGGGIMKGKKVFGPWGKERIGNGAGLGVPERERVDIEAGGRWEAPVTVAARDSVATSVASIPRWRDPITWARDQARRNDSRGESTLR